jgi:hypothetical protein
MLDTAADRLRSGSIGLTSVAAMAMLALWAESSLARGSSPIPVAVQAGRAVFDVPTSGPGLRTLVVVSALAREAGPFEVRLNVTGIPASNVRPIRIASDRTGKANAPRDIPPPLDRRLSIRTPVATRHFSLLVRDGDPASASNYLRVEGRIAAVGNRVQVYVDGRDVETVDQALVREIVTTFDEVVYPTCLRRFGPVEDVDGDGRFTIFVSSWLNRLAGGRIKVDGFVRPADFDSGLTDPFGNRSDMLYLSASLRPGPHLKTVLAHEFGHAITFSRRTFPAGPDGRLAAEEEGWLDEGLAHLIEDAHGFSRTNISYRVSAFLSRPERYRLIVDDYYAADLFRSHGNRGGTYLFLRWCVDRFGDDVLDRMVRSRLRGAANLEAATGRSFESLFREWTTALYMSGLDPATDGSLPDRYKALDPRGTIEDWVLAGPRSSRVKPDGAVDAWSAAGTSTHFAVVEGSSTGAIHVEVAGSASAGLQVTIVPLPEDLGEIALEVHPTSGRDGVLMIRAKVDASRESAIRLGAIAWEPLVPSPDATSAGFRRSGIDMVGIADHFGTSAIAPGTGLTSRSIRLEGVRPGDGPIVFKAVGTDAAGRRVAAWAEVEFGRDPFRESADEAPNP